MCANYIFLVAVFFSIQLLMGIVLRLGHEDAQEAPNGDRGSSQHDDDHQNPEPGQVGAVGGRAGFERCNEQWN